MQRRTTTTRTSRRRCSGDPDRQSDDNGVPPLLRVDARVAIRFLPLSTRRGGKERAGRRPRSGNWPAGVPVLPLPSRAFGKRIRKRQRKIIDEGEGVVLEREEASSLEWSYWSSRAQKRRAFIYSYINSNPRGKRLSARLFKSLSSLAVKPTEGVFIWLIIYIYIGINSP